MWWIYATAFALASLGIFFQAAQFAAIPSLVEPDELVAANGRIQASFSAATVVGPLAAGALLAFIPVESLLYVDALTFAASAVALALIARPFNAPREAAHMSIRADIVEGLRYVLRHPVLRNISAGSPCRTASLGSSSPLTASAWSCSRWPLRSRFSFGNVALGALMLSGVMTFVLAYAPSYLLAVVVSALSAGLGTLFNINTGSLRQAIVPNHLLGRIITIAMVLAWSANPLGSTVGGYIVERTGDVQTVYAVIGLLVFGIALYFRLFSPLGHAERYLETTAEAAAS